MNPFCENLGAFDITYDLDSSLPNNLKITIKEATNLTHCPCCPLKLASAIKDVAVAPEDKWSGTGKFKEAQRDRLRRRRTNPREKEPDLIESIITTTPITQEPEESDLARTERELKEKAVKRKAVMKKSYEARKRMNKESLKFVKSNKETKSEK